jgi:coenzyme F420-reducing hydrogenase alpha subunit
MKSERPTRTIRVDALARVEGEGALLVRLRGGVAEEVQLRIFEPPRFFEGFLRGRAQMEVPDITARICGICPVAYMMSSCHAIEDALGVRVDGPLRALRRLIYCGEWIESHALHVFLLHAPDFLGYEDALGMAKEHPEVVRRGLRIKKAGNALVTLLGGREVHPINVRVGGFYSTPTREALDALLPELAWAEGAVRESLEWLSTLTFPDFERDYELVALRHEDEYPFNEGRIASSKGLDIAPSEWGDHFEEIQVPHSTALHARLRARGPYLCGPLARFGLSFDRLADPVKEAAIAIGLSAPCKNPFKSILVRGIEMLHAFHEAQRLIRAYVPPAEPFVPIPLRAGTGHGATEAPRGLLYHRYTVDETGTITDARIVPPTSQNQKTIEDDLFHLAPSLAELSLRDATWRAEQAVRNYDPCISCSTHFLTLRIERE